MLAIISACLTIQSAQPLKAVKQKKTRLLFPLYGKKKDITQTLDALWELVRDDWRCYSFAFQQFLPEINHKIAQCWMMLEHVPSMSASKERFANILLGCCITTRDEEKEWNVGCSYLKRSDDHNFYIGYGEKCRTWTTFIYSVRACQIIKSFPFNVNNYNESFLKKRNIIFGTMASDYSEEPNQYMLYDVATCRPIELFPKAFYLVTDPSERFLAGITDDGLCVWDIADINNITYKKCDGKYTADNSKIRFLSDEKYIVYAHDSGKIILFAIENTQLKELEHHIYDNSGNSYIQFKQVDGVEYLMIKGDSQTTAYRTIGFRIEKNSEGIVTIKQIFDLQRGYVMEFLSKEKILVQYDQYLSIADYKGNIIHRNNDSVVGIHPGHPNWRDCCLFNKNISAGVEMGTISHLMRDENDDYIGFAQYPIAGTYFACPAAKYNAQKTFLMLWCQCFDLQGNMLKRIRKSTFIEIHPNGRSLLIKDKKSGAQKKRILYPKGADDHFKNVVSCLTIEKYSALQKVCGEVKKQQLLLAQNKDIVC